MQGLIFDIQYYSIYDGPGIRTTVYFKGCPLQCAWCHNPESQNTQFEIAYFPHKCVKCRKCIHVCKNKAIRYVKNQIQHDVDLCSMCGICVNICLSHALEIVGKMISPEEVVKLVLRDLIFYEASRGGVTISGGEPTAQADFLLNILEKLKKKGIHTAIETCGYFNKELIPHLIKVNDLFLFDIKHIDSSKHNEYTGVFPVIIKENFTTLVALVGKQRRIIPRIPVIPNFNADPASIEGIISFFKSASYDGPIHLMPYNSLSGHKYERIGKGDQYADMGTLSGDDISRIMAQCIDHGFRVVCNE